MAELAFRLLVKAPFMVVLPSNHRLAALKSSGPSDLAGEPFVTVSNKAPALRAVIDNFLKRSGIKVMSVQEDDHLSLGLWLMASTGGMGIQTKLLNLDRSWTENTSGGAGLYIRFTVEVTCGEEEPSRFVPRVEGEVFDFAGDEADEREVLVGRIGAYLVQRGRCFDEGESLFDAMDSIDQSVHDCYCALFDSKNDEWSAPVLANYADSIMSMDVLYIESIDLESQFKSMDITPIVRETIATFGSHCGLVAHEELPENAKIWTDIGFRKLADSDFYTYAPELLHQESDEPVPSASVSWANRVRRGRRRLG